MKIWVYLNGLQQGPYTFDQVKMLPLEPTTPVWYDGLSNWLPAAQAPLTAPLFGGWQPGPQADAPREAAQQQWRQDYWQAPPRQPSYADENGHLEPKPPTYMVWCILLTICCCSPFALAGIITGSFVSSRYNAGDYKGAWQMSRATEWLVIIAIVGALVYTPLAIAFGL